MSRGHAIGIGAQKAASSWVHDLLRLHPGVSVAAEKELDYFSHRFDRGHRWYRGQFPGGGLAFESSPSYLTDPRAPGRAAAFDPGLRIVVTLRDPVARAYSQHLHEIGKGHIPSCDFATALAHNPSYLEQGFYARHLTPWFAAFPRDRVLVLLAEELRADPAAGARALHRFLRLGPGPMLAEARNVSDRARLRWLRRALRAGGDAARAAGAEPALLRLKAAGPARRLLAWNSRPLRAEVPPLAAAERAELARLYRDDMAALAGMLGRRDLPWPSFAPARRKAG